jgi:DNA-binding NarL/FixJ family response regulator
LSTSRRVRVLIADDHPVVMEGLASLLRDHMDIVGTVSDGSQLVEAALSLRPDVIITDLSMPRMSGMEAMRRLKCERIESKFIVLTMFADRQLVIEATRVGASGFVLKQSAGKELMTAIDEVLQGRVYLSPALTPR